MPPAKKQKTSQITSNRASIFELEADVMHNKQNAYLGRALVQETRMTILGNYNAAFQGNRQMANGNTDDAFRFGAM
jgi:hypothetical protein